MKLHAFNKTVFRSFCHLEIAAFEFVVNCYIQDLIPYNIYVFARWNLVPQLRINLFQNVGTDKNTLKLSDTGCIRCCIFVNIRAAYGCTVQAELYAGNKSVFGIFDYCKVATLEFVLNILLSFLIPFNRYCLLFRNNIAVGSIYFLEHIPCTDENVFELGNTVRICCCEFFNVRAAVRDSGQAESHSLIETVF